MAPAVAVAPGAAAAALPMERAVRAAPSAAAAALPKERAATAVRAAAAAARPASAVSSGGNNFHVLVAGTRTLGGKVETLEVDEPRPLTADEVRIDIRSAGIGNWDDTVRTESLAGDRLRPRDLQAGG
jgi:hypothetical protein